MIFLKVKLHINAYHNTDTDRSRRCGTEHAIVWLKKLNVHVKKHLLISPGPWVAATDVTVINCRWKHWWHCFCLVASKRYNIFKVQIVKRQVEKQLWLRQCILININKSAGVSTDATFRPLSEGRYKKMQTPPKQTYTWYTMTVGLKNVKN